MVFAQKSDKAKQPGFSKCQSAESDVELVEVSTSQTSTTLKKKRSKVVFVQ
jgi:hypothetical protein